MIIGMYFDTKKLFKKQPIPHCQAPFVWLVALFYIA